MAEKTKPSIIITVDPEDLQKILSSEWTILPWVKNFKEPADALILCVRSGPTSVIVGVVDITCKVFVRYERLLKRIIKSGTNPASIDLDVFSKMNRVCLFSIANPRVLRTQVPVKRLPIMGDQKPVNRLGSGMYYRDEWPDFLCDLIPVGGGNQ